MKLFLESMRKGGRKGKHSYFITCALGVIEKRCPFIMHHGFGYVLLEDSWVPQPHEIKKKKCAITATTK